MSLLSSLASPEVSAPGTALAETSLLEVCSAKVRPHRLVVHQHVSWEARHLLRGLSIPSWMSNALSLPSGDQGRARTLSFPSASHLSDSGVLMLAVRVLIAVPCSVDELSIPTNTPEWNRGSHFPPLAGLAGMYRIFSPTSSIRVLSPRPCSLCSGVFPSLPTSHLLIRYAANSTSQPSMLAWSGTLAPIRCSSAAFSVHAWPATSPIARWMIPVDWLSPTGGLSRTV